MANVEQTLEGQVYVEVSKGEAEWCLRFEGSGGEEIGDGEVWTAVNGREKIWCEGCGLWWGFRVWVREM